MALYWRSMLLRGLAASLALGIGAAPVSSQAGASQTAPPEIVSNSPLQTVAAALRAKGIDLSRTSLLQALHHSDPAVRSLAALQLCEHRSAESVPSIKEALSIETDPRTRINFGLALWTAHDPDGVVTLHRLCSDPAQSIDITVTVVQELAIANESSEPCAAAVLHYVDIHLDSESRLRSLFALPDLYPWVVPDQADKVLALLTETLKDRDPAVRIQSAQSLVQIGLPSSAGPIRTQMTRESDPNIRDSLKSSLDQLAKKQ